MLKLGYKVVCVTEVTPRSLCAAEFGNSMGVIKYPLNTWTEPRRGYGPLTVLASRRAARHLKKTISYGHMLAIKRCLYEPSNENSVWRCLSHKHLKELEDLNSRTLIPGHTRLAKRVMIFKGREQMVKLGFKVTRKYSTWPFASATSNGMRTEYRKGEWVYPLSGCGPLTVFKSRRAARCYVKNFASGGTIHRCLYVPSKETVLYNGPEKLSEISVESLEAQHSGFLMAGHTKTAKSVMIF